MSHQQKHDKHRHEKQVREQRREEEWENQPRSIHPAWFVSLGVVLIFVIVLTWMML